MAKILDARDSAVSGALTNLKRRGLVHTRHRVYYAAGAVTGRGRVTELVGEIRHLVVPGRSIDWARVADAGSEIAALARARRRP